MEALKEVHALENEGNIRCILHPHLTPVGVAEYLTAELMLIAVLINGLSVISD